MTTVERAAKKQSHYAENVEKPEAKKDAISRRDFCRAAAGAAGAAVAFGGAKEVLAQNSEQGEITLDALLISYFSASVGGTDVPRWMLKGNYANTIRLNVVEAPDLVLKPKPGGRGRKIFAGHKIEQFRSSQVKNGLVMRHQGFNNWTFGFGVEGVAHTHEDTVFFSIFRPRLQITGTPNKVRFRFTGDDTGNGGALFPASVGGLRAGEERDYLSQETIDSWLALYVTDRAALVGPRFQLKTDTGVVGPGVGIPIRVAEDGDRQFSAAKTATTTARIIAQSGFTSDALKQAFAVGNHLEITHASVQEVEEENTVRMETTITRATGGVSEIYWDSLFKTFLIVDAGPLL